MNQRKTTKNKENAQRDPRVVSPSPGSLSFLFTFSIAQPSSNLPKVQKKPTFPHPRAPLKPLFSFPFPTFSLLRKPTDNYQETFSPSPSLDFKS